MGTIKHKNNLCGYSL